MAQISDLIPEFASLTHEQQLEKIRKIREQRKARPKNEHKKKRVRSAKAKTKAEKLLDNMTPEQKIALLKQLQG